MGQNLGPQREDRYMPVDEFRLSFRPNVPLLHHYQQSRSEVESCRCVLTAKSSQQGKYGKHSLAEDCLSKNKKSVVWCWNGVADDVLLDRRLAPIFTIATYTMSICLCIWKSSDHIILSHRLCS